MTQSPSSSCGTARVATVPRSGISRASGHVPTAPRGISVTGTGGTTGISADADNLLILGSDLKPFISCLIIDECLDGRFEPLGAVEDAFVDHLAAANPHSQYLLSADYNPITDHGALGGLGDNDHPQYLLSTAYTAADVLAKLLTVDTDIAGINATTLQGYTPASFDAAGAAGAVSALLTTHANLTNGAHGISAFGAGLVASVAASNARTTLELGTMALETAANYLRTSGADVGAAIQRQVFTLGFTGPSWRPASDSTTALQMQNAAGTAFLIGDTTNQRIFTKTIAPITTAGGDVGMTSLEYFNVYARNFISGGTLNLTAGASGAVSISANGVSNIVNIGSTIITISKNISLTAGATISGTGNLLMGDPTGANRQHALHGHTTFTPGIDATSNGPVIVTKGYTGQTLDLFQAQNVSAAVLFAIGPDGKIKTNQAVTNTNTPTGATAYAMPFYDAAGTLLGYVPLHATQW